MTSGVAGFLRPGDRVDVYWTGNARGETVTRLIREAVQIIAIDQITDEDRNNPIVARTITIEAHPTEIATLNLSPGLGPPDAGPGRRRGYHRTSSEWSRCPPTTSSAIEEEVRPRHRASAPCVSAMAAR